MYHVSRIASSCTVYTTIPVYHRPSHVSRIAKLMYHRHHSIVLPSSLSRLTHSQAHVSRLTHCQLMYRLHHNTGLPSSLSRLTHCQAHVPSTPQYSSTIVPLTSHA